MNRPLNVLIVSQPVSYGVAICVRDLTQAAVAAGHRVTVVSPDSSHGPLAGWIEAAGARHLPLNMARTPALRDVSDLLAIRRLSRGRDVIHLHSSKAGALGRVAAMSIGRRHRPAVVFTAHYWSWLVGGRWARLYRWIERVLARRCDAIVAVSDGEAEEGRAVLGARAPLRSIPNGVDRDRFSPIGDRADRIDDVPLIVCVGRLSEQKGQDVAIRALALLADRTARLRLVGDESGHGERARLDALAASLGVSDRIEWRGGVDTTAPEYRAADVVVAPSRWDGLSLALLEGMACGAAIVASEVNGSECLGEAGRIVPPDDPGSLAEAVADLLGSPPERARLGRAARERSRSFDLATTMERNLDLWSGLADRAAGGRDAAATRAVADGGEGAARWTNTSTS
ncbi:MAG: putative glycosyl transferase [Actinomycetia bacterium]|nr:putative glycosyl transferase [Actinomycetes bacterium]